MTLPSAILLLIAGLLLLWKGADVLVDNSVRLAKQLGVSSLVIGLTIVAMGTSAPEVAASIAAVLKGMGSTAVGNVFGSNIANLALVAGVAALINPLQIDKKTMRREIPVMLIVSLVLLPVLYNGTISRPEGIVLLVIFVALIVGTILTTKRKGISEHSPQQQKQQEQQRQELQNASEQQQPDKSTGCCAEPSSTAVKPARMGRDIAFIVLGLVALAVGAKLTLSGATTIGKLIGLSDAVIGLTIIAVGTSLPELITCVVAALKGHHAISIGNLVGSNIFNTLLVTGSASVVRPITVGRRFAGGVDYWIMVAVGVGFVLAAVAGKNTITRKAAVVFLLAYICYTVYLVAYT